MKCFCSIDDIVNNTIFYNNLSVCFHDTMINQNQTGNLDRAIKDQAEHFVYVPQKSTVNPQDVAFFLSTRLVEAASKENAEENETDANALVENGDATSSNNGNGGDEWRSASLGNEDPAKRLRRYESKTLQLSSEFEEGMVRF